MQEKNMLIAVFQLAFQRAMDSGDLVVIITDN